MRWVEPCVAEEGAIHHQVVEFDLFLLVVANVAVMDSGVAVVLPLRQAD